MIKKIFAKETEGPAIIVSGSIKKKNIRNIINILFQHLYNFL